MNTTWYEIYENTTNGTRTVAICDTLEEAIKLKNKYMKENLDVGYELHIDEWKQEEGNPEQINLIM